MLVRFMQVLLCEFELCAYLLMIILFKKYAKRQPYWIYETEMRHTQWLRYSQLLKGDARPLRDHKNCTLRQPSLHTQDASRTEPEPTATACTL
jgi:hypothetical protein